MASTHLQRSISTTGNRKKWTWSAWVKRSALKASGSTYMWSENNSPYFSTFMFTDDSIRYYEYDNAFQTQIKTNRVFRDTSAWYHIVLTVDTAQATSTDRVKIYINGVQETSMSISTYPSQNFDTFVNTSGQTLKIGVESSGSNFDGLMTHIHFCDGYAYSPTDFGSTDSTTGIWKPITSPSVTYGTNGYFLDFANSSDMGNDVSGNNNDFTVTGTMTQTIDTPSNVFATFNALYNSNQNLSNGNLSATNTTSTWNSRASTLAGSSGKYYAEYKINKPGTSYHMNGVGDIDYIVPSTHAGAGTGLIAYYSDSGEKYVEGTNTSYGDTYGDGDIIGIALDLDNGYVYFSKNGTWQNSGNPTSGASGTGGIALPTTGTYAFTESVRSATSSNSKVDANFGNGYFGTTAVASAGTNSGIGTFEYDVPSGYKALCTKNINEQEYS